MKLIIAISILFYLSASQNIYGQTRKIDHLKASIESLRKAMIDPDSLILANLASEDLVYVHSSGTARDKKGFIDEYMLGWTMLSDATIKDQVITLSGQNAIVRHRLIGDFDKPGQTPQFDIIILMVWRLEDDQWKLLAQQAAKIP
ncbi:MAG: nuclear transport factor 2 family protein [Saprospiraceae bacterium]|nr:nuclear transport factor 2 family protein [Saprospiraceae bacterium]